MNIDELRTKTLDELTEIGRRDFGVELAGNKVTRLSKLKSLIETGETEAAKDNVATTDVTLEKMGPDVGEIIPAEAKYIMNPLTGMVFPTTPVLRTRRDLVPYWGEPVLIDGCCLMAKEKV